MKESKFVTMLIVLLVCLVTPQMLMAQSSADKLYNQGLTLQKTRTVKSQNSAIKKFSQAKSIYDSKANKDKCDNAIATSREIINNLNNSGGGRSGRRKDKTEPQVVKEPAINAQPHDYSIDSHSNTLDVAVVAVNVDKWEAIPMSNSDGSSFLTVSRNGNDGIRIHCKDNPTTQARSQKVLITGGTASTEVVVNQQGRPVNIMATDPLLEFGKKGGRKNTSVFCNATEKFSDNNDRNWHVVSKPDWISVVINNNPKKGGFFNKMVDKVKEVTTGDDGPNVSYDMVETAIVVTADKIAKGTSEYENGRKGEVIIGAGNKTITILITQK